MKILNPSEYKKQNPQAYLKDYLEYLENAQLEAEESLASAKKYPLKGETIKEIEKQIEDIFNMALIVESYMGQVVLNTVDTLSLEDLQSYFGFDKILEEIAESRQKLEDEKEDLNNQLSEVEEKINATLYENGRVGSFYQAEDVADFFKDSKSEKEYVANLLKMDLGNIESLFRKAIKTECDIQNKTLTDDEVELTIKQITGLFAEAKKIVKYSNNATDEMANIILSAEGLGSIIPTSLDKNSYLFMIQDLINLEKYNTSFFGKLPERLRKDLVSERLRGSKFAKLKKVYEAYQKGEELPSEDLNEEENKTKTELTSKISKIDYDLMGLKAKENSTIDFSKNVEAMRAALREMIVETLDKNQASLKDIDTTIGKVEEEKNKKAKELQETSAALAEKQRLLAEAKKMLMNQDYHSFFYAVERNNVRRIYNAFGVNVTEEVVKPILDEEKRRSDQINIMTEHQSQLEKIQSEIERKKSKLNFITKHLPSYKKEIADLEEKYNKEVAEVYSLLKFKNLFSVNTPSISNESTIGNIILIPSETTDTEPENFEELQGKSQTFWNITKGIDVNVQKAFLEKAGATTEWAEYAASLMKRQDELVTKLFNYKKDALGFYNFEITEDERKELVQLQTLISSIAQTLYDGRRAFRQTVLPEAIVLDEEKKKEIERFLGKGANLSRENLANYIDLTEEEVQRLTKVLEDNIDYCNELGIEVPQSVADKQNSTEHNSFDSDVQKLNIKDVNTLEEAIKYRNLLLGLEEYTVPAEEARQYYLSRTSKK